MSGDHGQKDYNEVKAMKLEAMEEGILRGYLWITWLLYIRKHLRAGMSLLLTDVIVTQEYHLYRALHVANALGGGYGVPQIITPM